MRLAPRLLAAVALATAIPACASRPIATPEAPGLAAQDSVLDWAVLHEPVEGGLVRFSLARPGYVAVFAIAPGEGVRLLYPTNAGQNVRIDRGTYTRTTRRGVVSAARLARLNAGYVPEVRYLYLIASSRPLHLQEPLRWPDGARFTGSSLGGVPFDPRSQDVHNTMEVLFDLVVPDANSAVVDTDVYAYYPDVRFRRGGRMYALSAFRCFDGRVVYAPAYFGGSYFPDDWFGVDFFNNRYVGSGCYLGYVAGGQTGGGAFPTTPATPASRLRTTEAIQPRDIRPHIPLDPAQLQPVVPGIGGASTKGAESLEGESRQSTPRFHPRTRPPERLEETPSMPRDRESPQRAEPRMQPAEREPVRAGPMRPEPVRSEPVRSEPVRSEPVRSEPRSEPVRSEPVRSEPVRSEPVRSEPVRSEPVRSEPRRPEPVRPDPDPAAR